MLESAIAVLAPEQIVCAAGVAVATGVSFTVTVTVPVLTHPFASVPVTVYVVVVVGLAVTAAPVVADNPVEGLHVYVLAPLAVKLILLPVQIVGADGVMVIAGKALTVCDNGTTELVLSPIYLATIE